MKKLSEDDLDYMRDMSQRSEDGTCDTDDLLNMLPKVVVLVDEFRELKNKLAQRDESIRKLNAYIGWNATNACSGEISCWCDAHEGNKP